MTVITASTGLINSSQSDSAAKHANRSSTTVKQDAPATSVSDDSSETVKLSTRSQKIQKLNEEFFSAGPSAFKISIEFIDRLKEYGLLSASEADKISISSAQTNQTDEAKSTLGELSIFIDGFLDDIKKTALQSTIISVLEQAQTVIDNLNEPTASSREVNIPSIVEQLKNYNATAAKQLPEADQESLNQLVLALNIANALSPGTNTTAQIDRYLAINNFES